MDPAEFRRRRAEAADHGRGGEPVARRESMERARAESPPERAAIKHGLFAEGLAYMPCDNCALADQCPHYQAGQQCPLERAWMDQFRPLVAQAVQARGLDPELFSAQITAAVHAQIRYYRNKGYALVEGEVRLDSEAGGFVETPSAGRVDRLERAMHNSFDQLGISAAALAALEGERGPGQRMQAAVCQMDQLAQKGLGAGEGSSAQRPEAEDAEFEAAPAEPPEPPAASDEQRAASDGDDSQGAVEAGEGFDAQAEAGMEGPVA